LSEFIRHGVSISGGLWHKLGHMPRFAATHTSKPRKAQLDAEKLRALAMNYAARYATTRAKMLRYLNRKIDAAEWVGTEGPAPERLVTQMTERGFVNDAAFAEMRVLGLARRGFGERRVRQALWQAGIEPDDADAAVSQHTDSPDQAALRFAKRKGFGPFSLKPAQPDERKRQLAAFCRAGHDFSTACKILDLNEDFVQD
jgi:regulatory protein